RTVAFDLERIHNILHAFIHMEGDLQLALIVDHLRSNGCLAVACVPVYALKVPDTFAEKLLAVFPSEKEMPLGNRYMGEKVIAIETPVPLDAERSYFPLL